MWVFNKIDTQRTKCLLHFLFIFCLLCSTTFVCYGSEKEIDLLKQRELIRLFPLGDHTHVDVYDFIVESLKESQTKRKDVMKIVQIEKENVESHEVYKPYLASVGETQLSHILSALCRADKKCVAVALFDQAGLSDAIGQAQPGPLPNAVDRVYIGDKIFEAFTDKTQTNPILTPLDEKMKGFTWNPFAKFVSITYPIYFSQEHDTASLRYEKGFEKLIGFAILVRQQD
jgi:hypothetical protein